MGMILTQTDLATLFGVSSNTIREWRRQGLPREDASGRSHQYDSEKVIAWYLDFKRPMGDDGGKEYHDAQYRKYKAGLMRIKYLREANATVSVQDCVDNMAKRLTVIADQIKTIPLSWAPYLVGTENQAEAQKILQGLLDDMLTVLQSSPDPELAGSDVDLNEFDDDDED